MDKKESALQSLKNVGIEVVHEDTWVIQFRNFATQESFTLTDEQIAAVADYSQRD